MDELRELLSESFLRLWGGMLIWCVVEPSGRDLGCKPVGFGETQGQGNEVLLDLLLRKLIADLVERLDSLCMSVCVLRYMRVASYLVAYERLLDRGQILKR